MPDGPRSDGPDRERSRPLTYVSVDVETAGPSPSGYALLSIGACLLEQPEHGFYVELKPDRAGEVPSAMAVSGLSLEQLAATGEEPATALASWEAWLEEVVPSHRAPLFVGFNAAFDWMFVADYFERYLGRNPFGHSAMDIKSYAQGLLGVGWYDTSMTRLGRRFLDGRTLRHNALEDARDQAELFRAIRDSAPDASRRTE
ncbi:MAG: 3'-5' exonuclease [Actinomycetales bacterium]|nr:3'-5' exonuclease [Actinomycetales bacterium]